MLPPLEQHCILPLQWGIHRDSHALEEHLQQRHLDAGYSQVQSILPVNSASQYESLWLNFHIHQDHHSRST